MSAVEVVDLTTLARGFPRVTGPEIDREYILDTIDKVFEGKVDALLLEGEEGVGKTVLLSQFAKRHYKNTISLFVRPASRAAIDPAYIAYVLAEQIYWMLYEEPLPATAEIISDSDLLTYFSQLERKLFRKKSLCFVVVDGLEDTSPSTQQLVHLTLNDLLPFGLPSYRYLISGSVEQIGRKLHKSLVVRPFSAPYCSLDDAVRYLDGLSLEKPQIEDLYKLSTKIFGRLATVRRLIQSGTPATQLLDEAPPDFIELEWRSIANGPATLKELISIVAFAQGSYDAPTLSTISNMDVGSILGAVQQSGFLVHDSSTGEISFCSDAHRRFAQRKLSVDRDRILDILISFHLKTSHPLGELSPLPEYFRQARRHRDLLAFLNTEYFLDIAENTQSLTAIQQGTTFGFQASLELEDLGGITRFAAQGALLLSLSSGETTKAEMEARIQLGDKALAIGLAQRASLKENRLELLAAAAAALKKAHNDRDEALLGQISSLIDQVDLGAMKQRAIDVAADLATVDPDIAFRVLQRSAKTDDTSASVDNAFAALAMRTLHQGQASAAITTAEKGRSQVKDPEIQQFLTSLSLFLGAAHATEVIQHAKSFEPTRALFFLRQWASVTRAYEEAGTVIEYALDTLLKTTSYTPKIRDLRELATPLCKLPDKAALAKLIQRFDSQRATVLDLGTNEDLIRLQLCLAESEATLNLEKAHRRFFEIYWQTSELRDLSTKVSCLGWMISHYAAIDRDGSLDEKEGTLSVLRQDLDTCIHELLASTAEHFDVAKGALRAFARTSIANGLAIADSLNTVARRDEAYREIVRYACRPKLATKDIEGLQRATTKISAYAIRDSALSTLVGAFCQSDFDFGTSFKAIAASLCGLCQTARYSSMRAGVLADMYNRIRREANDSYRDLELETLQQIDTAWSSIDTVWRKAQVAFQIAKNLGKNDPETAKHYVKRGEDLGSDPAIAAENQFDQYSLLISLLLRAFSGLLPNRLEDSASLGLIERCIDVIPSRGERSALWSEVASRAFLQGRKDFCEEIVSKYVRPLYDLIPQGNDGARWSALVQISPTMFIAHQASAIDRIARAPAEVQEESAYNVIHFLLRKTPLDDAFVSRPISAVRIKPDDVLDIFSLFQFVKTDSKLYYPIKWIVDYVLSKRGRQDFSKQTLADISDRIERDILPKLPDLNNIKHDGYVVATRALILRLRVAPLEQWNQLARLATIIPNTADRAYVLLAVACGMVHRFASEATELFRAAKSAIDRIPAVVDRIDRWSLMAEEIMEVNEPLARECIKSAYNAACISEDADSLEDRRRELLDLAHNIDSSFASTLAEQADEDPARMRIKREATERIKTLELEKSLSTDNADLNKLSDNKEKLANAAWRALGLLNARWTEPVHVDQLRKYIPVCIGSTLDNAYPVMSWVIENLVRRTSNTPAAKSTFSNLVFALAQLAEAAVAIIGSTGGRKKLELTKLATAIEPQTSASIVIAPGERDRALSFLTKWITDHVEGYLKICDPYFGISDLELLRIIKGIKPDSRITVLTSKKVQEKGVDLSETYASYWKNQISPHSPGNCEVVIVGTVDKGELPIHDRWWITKGSGLRLGTSFNTLGINKTSDISLLQNDEANEREQEIDDLLLRTKREHNGSALGFLAIAL